ncbi:MAG: YSC84-related protein [Geminicoccaceae bacterium]
MMRSLFTAAFLGVFLSACNTVQTSSDPSADTQSIVNASEDVVRRFMSSSQADAIGGLLSTAKGVIVYPNIVKAAFFVGGEGGTGVLVGRQDNNGWSSPAFFTFGAASYGFQIGAEQSNILLIITNQETLERATAGGLELGANASVAVGDEGAKGTLSTDQLQDIYYFVEVERGLFAGVNLKGATAVSRDSLNAAYYGSAASAKDIVLEGRFSNPGASGLQAALASRS